MEPRTYKFRIDAFRPDTIPMARLAEYMAVLAKMMGEAERVHFVAVEEGSTILAHQVEPEAIPKVQDRLDSVRRGEKQGEPFKAFEELNRFLEKDNAQGMLYEGEAEVIPFPGVKREKPITYKGIKQAGSLDGVLFRVGGRDKTAHATLVDDDRSYSCELPWEIAREIARHLAGPVLRVHGTGRWNRTEEGCWELQIFRVQSFDVLNDAPLPTIMEALKAIPGNEWFNMEDPHQALAELRNGDEALH
jgi:hypothetical protein